MFSSNADSDNLSLLSQISMNNSRVSFRHYDSVDSSSSSDIIMSAPAHKTTINTTNRNNNKTRRLFGVTVMIGLLVILSTTMMLQSENNDDGDHWMTHLGLANDNDDDDGSPYYESDFRDVLPVPLFGRSRSYRAQQEADASQAFLNLDDESEKQMSFHMDEIQLLGSSRSSLTEKNKVEAPDGCEGTVVLLRHCEKGNIREHCNYQGYERSVYLASLFGSDDDDDSSQPQQHQHDTTSLFHNAPPIQLLEGYRWPKPSYIFALNPGARRNPKKKNFRELETIMPMAEKFNMTVDSSYTTLQTKKLARKIQSMFRSGDMCGKVMVVSWKHSKIPKLASALACGPQQGCPYKYPGKSFDDVWQIKVSG